MVSYTSSRYTVRVDFQATLIISKEQTVQDYIPPKLETNNKKPIINKLEQASKKLTLIKKCNETSPITSPSASRGSRPCRKRWLKLLHSSIAYH